MKKIRCIDCNKIMVGVTTTRVKRCGSVKLKLGCKYKRKLFREFKYRNIKSPKNPNLIYYGPHPCQVCDKDGKKGTLIVKADEFEFDFVHDSHYPNHIWKKHKHIKQ